MAWWPMPVIPSTGEAVAGGSQVEGQFRKSQWDVSQKQNTNKRTRGVVQVVECLPSLWWDPGFNHLYGKEKEEKVGRKGREGKGREGKGRKEGKEGS
jgi:hypothetical protein